MQLKLNKTTTIQQSPHIFTYLTYIQYLTYKTSFHTRLTRTYLMGIKNAYKKQQKKKEKKKHKEQTFPVTAYSSSKTKNKREKNTTTTTQQEDNFKTVLRYRVYGLKSQAFA